MTHLQRLGATLAAPLALFAFASASHAQTTLAQFNFNSLTPDNNTATGSTAQSAGAQAASLALVGTTATFASGNGSSDPATTDDSAYNTTGYPAQGTGSLTEGIQFNVNTTGFENIVFSFDSQASNTGSRFVGIRYTTDGTNFITYSGPTTTTGTAGAGGNRTDGLFEFFTGGATFVNGRTVNFTGIAGVANNALFGVQVLSVFAPGTSAYAAANTASTYGTAGTLRYDNVTFTGTAIGGNVAAPEPASLALVGVGLIGGIVARRRK